jgi:hypothetical protein
MLYPFFFISGSIIEPIAAVLATDDPVTPAKIIDAATQIIPRLPLIKQNNSEEKAIIRFDMPPVVINCPASINNGIARRSQESNPKNIL